VTLCDAPVIGLVTLYGSVNVLYADGRRLHPNLSRAYAYTSRKGQGLTRFNAAGQAAPPRP